MKPEVFYVLMENHDKRPGSRPWPNGWALRDLEVAKAWVEEDSKNRAFQTVTVTEPTGAMLEQVGIRRMAKNLEKTIDKELAKELDEAITKELEEARKEEDREGFGEFIPGL